jgi:hypothetical protein
MRVPNEAYVYTILNPLEITFNHDISINNFWLRLQPDQKFFGEKKDKMVKSIRIYLDDKVVA